MPRFMRSVLPTLVLLAQLPAALGQTPLILVNKCQDDLNVFTDGRLAGKLPAAGGSATTKLPDNFQSGFWTTAYGGRENGTRTTQVHLRPKDGYYFVLLESGGFTTGVSIKPNRDPENGFCDELKCTDSGCSSAFRQRPTIVTTGNSVAPPSPLFQCPRNQGFVVTFCPEITPPLPPLPPIVINKPPPPPQSEQQQQHQQNHHHHHRRSRALHPGGNRDKCLDVRDDVHNGSPVQIFDCVDNSPRQRWEFKDTFPTQVRLAGTNLCLDADAAPNDGVKLQLWECNGKPQQNWFYTADKRLALIGKWREGRFVGDRAPGPDVKGLCMDLPNGNDENGNRIQVWQCTDRNANQVWTV